MPNTNYYKKPSKREDFWTGVAMRVVLAIIGFGIALVAQSLIFRRVIFIIWSWHAFILPTIVAVIVLFFPDALNRWFSGQNEVSLSDVKESSKKK